VQPIIDLAARWVVGRLFSGRLFSNRRKRFFHPQRAISPWQTDAKAKNDLLAMRRGTSHRLAVGEVLPLRCWAVSPP